MSWSVLTRIRYTAPGVGLLMVQSVTQLFLNVALASLTASRQCPEFGDWSPAVPPHCAAVIVVLSVTSSGVLSALNIWKSVVKLLCVPELLLSIESPVSTDCDDRG